MDLLPYSSQAALIIALALLLWAMMRRVRPDEVQTSPPPTPLVRAKAQRNPEEPLRDAPADFTRWQVELHELARDVRAELETRLAVLRLMTTQADAAAERLERAIAKARQLGIDERSDRLSAIDVWSGETEARLEQPPTHPQAEVVARLAERERSSERIAAATGLPLGEVELLLSTMQRS